MLEQKRVSYFCGLRKKRSKKVCASTNMKRHINSNANVMYHKQSPRAPATLVDVDLSELTRDVKRRDGFLNLTTLVGFARRLVLVQTSEVVAEEGAFHGRTHENESYGKSIVLMDRERRNRNVQYEGRYMTPRT